MSEIIDSHEPIDYVDILESVYWLIEQKFFATYGLDADINDLLIVIEDSPDGDSLKCAKCQYFDDSFRVNLPG